MLMLNCTRVYRDTRAVTGFGASCHSVTQDGPMSRAQHAYVYLEITTISSIYQPVSYLLSIDTPGE